MKNWTTIAFVMTICIYGLISLMIFGYEFICDMFDVGYEKITSTKMIITYLVTYVTSNIVIFALSRITPKNKD